MTRCTLVAVVLLAGCEQEDPVAYIQEYVRVQVVLDDGTPSRSWNLHVETNDAAMRDGLTWTTLDVGATVTPATIDPWPEQWVDVALTGDEVAEETLHFDTPVQQLAHVTERYQAECLAGEPCTWDYVFVATRREGGSADMGIDYSARALVTLGYESTAPDGAVLTIEATEIED